MNYSRNKVKKIGKKLFKTFLVFLPGECPHDRKNMGKDSPINPCPPHIAKCSDREYPWAKRGRGRTKQK